MTSQPITLEYATRHERSVFVFYFVYLFMICVPAAVMGWIIFFEVPRFTGVFRDFKTALPLMTEWLMNITGWCRSPLVWPFLIVGMLLAPWMLAKWTLRFKNTTQRLMAAIIIMVALIFLALGSLMFIQLGLMMPLMKLVHSVSGGT